MALVAVSAQKALQGSESLHSRQINDCFYKNQTEEKISFLLARPDWVPVGLAHHKPKRSNVFADYLKAVKFVAPQLSLALTTHLINL